MPLIRGCVKPLTIAIVCWIVAAPAAAFGPDGHLIVGYLADSYICTGTRAAIKPLMGRYSLGETGVWADQIRSSSEWAKADAWHYLNIGDKQDIATRRKSSRGDVLQAIDRFSSELADPDIPRAEKIDALRFLVHFIADVHQPLHVGRASDKGGNTIEVRVRNDASNLHVLWDSYVIREARMQALDYSRTLRPMADKNLEEWQNSTPLDWARESQALRPQVYSYGRPAEAGYVTLDEAYMAQAREIIDRRLAQAGVRLAGALNEIYCDTPAGPAAAP